MKKYQDIKFDERQRIAQGKAYKYALFTLLGLMLLCYVIRDCCDLYIFVNSTQLLICLIPSSAVCVISMIANNAYDGIYEKNGKLWMSIIGVMGFLGVVMALLQMINNKMPIISDGMLSDEINSILFGIYFVLISTVYWTHNITERKKITNEE